MNKKIIKTIFFGLLLMMSFSFLACKKEEAHEHTYEYKWTYDDNYHWHIATCGHDLTTEKEKHVFVDGYCEICGAKNNEHVHTYSSEWTYNENYHWHVATCGHDVTSDNAAHTFEFGYCTVCGMKEPEVIEEHTHTFSTEWTSDENYHWHVSTCGHDVTSEKDQHTYVDGYCSVCGHAEPVHNHTFTSLWTYDENYHWHEATCGHDVTTQKEAHTYVDGYCSSCGVKEPEHVHTFETKWSYDENYHYHASTCGHDVVDNKESHTYVDGYCSVCGAKEPEHVHTFEADWTYDENKHWHVSTCGHDVKDSEGNHTFKDGYCSVCGMVEPKDEPDPSKGELEKLLTYIKNGNFTFNLSIVYNSFKEEKYTCYSDLANSTFLIEKTKDNFAIFNSYQYGIYKNDTFNLLTYTNYDLNTNQIYDEEGSLQLYKASTYNMTSLLDAYNKITDSSIKDNVLYTYFVALLTEDKDGLKSNSNEVIYSYQDNTYKLEGTVKGYQIVSTLSNVGSTKVTMPEAVKTYFDELAIENAKIHEVYVNVDTKKYTGSVESEDYTVSVSHSGDYSYIYVKVSSTGKLFSDNVKLYINGKQVATTILSKDKLQLSYQMADPNWSPIV